MCQSNNYEVPRALFNLPGGSGGPNPFGTGEVVPSIQRESPSNPASSGTRAKSVKKGSSSGGPVSNSKKSTKKSSIGKRGLTI